MACSQPWERGFLKYMPFPFYSARVVVLQLHDVSMVSHMQALAHSPQLYAILNTWILITESISILAACS